MLYESLLHLEGHNVWTQFCKFGKIHLKQLGVSYEMPCTVEDHTILTQVFCSSSCLVSQVAVAQTHSICQDTSFHPHHSHKIEWMFV